MDKIMKTILIVSIAIFGAGLFAQSARAIAPIDPLIVEFQNSPLFNEANFAPGASVTRWVRVANNSGATQKIITEVINKTDEDNLGAKLNLVIKEGTTEIFNNTLKEFFNNGETILSDLANNANTQYDFTITFDSGTGDDFQGKTLGFDIIVGFQGQEGGGGGQEEGGGDSGTGQSGSGGGGGGGNPGIPGLTIYNEALVSVTDTTATLTWATSYAATSQVIYGTADEAHTLNLSDSSGTPPKYGYANTTLEFDTALKVVYHTITITGLTPGTTYYYRAVSHASLAIGQELAFTTIGVEPLIISSSQNQNQGEVSGAAIENPEQPAETGAETEIEIGTETNAGIEQGIEQVASIVKPSLLASIFNFTGFGESIRTIIIIVLIILLIYLIILFFTRKSKKENPPQNPNLKNGQWK